jgi:adenine-specific DNA glycosylase
MMGVMATPLERVLARLEAAAGPADPLPARDGWELVLAENVAYLVDDATRGRSLARLRRDVGLDPEAILSARPEQLSGVVAGMRPQDRVTRLRRCAELRLAGAPWRSYPGIGRPGVERIELFSGERAVLALDSNAARVLYRLGYGERRRSYDAMYREIQAAAQAELPVDVVTLQRAHQLLRRHGKDVCTRSHPACGDCPLRNACAAGQQLRPLEDPFAKA